ncbi:hypothetical protein MKX01_015109 [Papaver californicum]|nr:hypothetical protein MKX01_015109 [Papaver californicum]
MKNATKYKKESKKRYTKLNREKKRLRRAVVAENKVSLVHLIEENGLNGDATDQDPKIGDATNQDPINGVDCATNQDPAAPRACTTFEEHRKLSWKNKVKRRKEEKLAAEKRLQDEFKQNPGSHPSNQVGDESRRSTSISQENLEKLMTSIKKDPCLKPIVEDIEIGGPTVMMRYLNDPDVLSKLAQAMGFGDGVNSVEHNAPHAAADVED